MGRRWRTKNEGIDGYLRVYHFRRRAHGAESADKWFREKVVPSKSASWVGATAFDEREFDLLWLLPDDEKHWTSGRRPPRSKEGRRVRASSGFVTIFAMRMRPASTRLPGATSGRSNGSDERADP